MSLAHSHDDMVPRGVLVLIGLFVAFSIAAVSLLRITGVPAAATPTLHREAAGVAPVATRNLRFTDRADGAVVIIDSDRGGTASVIQPGEQTGFIRGVMRGLARDRKMRGIGDQPPFALTLWKDGELSLTDSATGRSIELTAFGSANRAAFAALLPTGAAK